MQVETEIERKGAEMSEEYVNAAAWPAQLEMKATLGFVVSPSDVSDSSVIRSIFPIVATEGNSSVLGFVVLYVISLF